MQPDEQFNQSQPPPTREKIGLFYYERVGSRYYLRFTRLTVMLVVGLTVISIAALLVFFLSNHRNPPKEVNVTITIPESSPNPPTQTIIQPAPVRQPTPIKQPIINIPAPSPPSPLKVNEITNNALVNTPPQAKSNRNSNEP